MGIEKSRRVPRRRLCGKRRTLWGIFNPIEQYNDRLICLQSLGEEKNGQSGYVNLDSLYETQVNEQATVLAQQINANINKVKMKVDNTDLISVYPNPASTQLTISYHSNEDGYFKLYNSFGEIVMTTSLSKNVTKTQMQINDIANGLYHYEIQFGNDKKSIGKLSILK